MSMWQKFLHFLADVFTGYFDPFGYEDVSDTKTPKKDDRFSD